MEHVLNCNLRTTHRNSADAVSVHHTVHPCCAAGDHHIVCTQTHTHRLISMRSDNFTVGSCEWNVQTATTDNASTLPAVAKNAAVGTEDLPEPIHKFRIDTSILCQHSICCTLLRMNVCCLHTQVAWPVRCDGVHAACTWCICKLE